MPEEKYMGLFGDVVFPLPKTFWDDYATRGSAARTQKMRVDDDLRMIQDLKVPETLEPQRRREHGLVLCPAGRNQSVHTRTARGLR